MYIKLFVSYQVWCMRLGMALSSSASCSWCSQSRWWHPCPGSRTQCTCYDNYVDYCIVTDATKKVNVQPFPLFFVSQTQPLPTIVTRAEMLHTWNLGCLCGRWMRAGPWMCQLVPSWWLACWWPHRPPSRNGCDGWSRHRGHHRSSKTGSIGRINNWERDQEQE